MQKTKEPIVLTVNGKEQLVVQYVKSYQAVLEAKERMDAITGIKRGLEAMQSAKGKSADTFFAEFFAEHDHWR
jgi:PHD/YefM family antitoxin component YafN of YafNO toxin-antitoxin module